MRKRKNNLNEAWLETVYFITIIQKRGELVKERCKVDGVVEER